MPRDESAGESDEIVVDGEARRRGSRSYTQLVVDGVEVGVYRARAYKEPLGNFGVGQAPGHQLEHLQLARAQSAGCGRGRARSRGGLLSSVTNIVRDAL